MIDKIKNILKQKHILIIGKTEIDRRNCINELIYNIDFEVFRFPSNMKSFDEYYNFVKEKKLYTPWYFSKKYNSNQILDFHWDWIDFNYNSLIIIEEFELMEKRWKIGLLKTFLNEIAELKKGEKCIHLIITQSYENGLIDELAKVINTLKNDNRTNRQVVEQNLEVIEI